MEEYLALVEAGQDEIIEKKSRFIGCSACRIRGGGAGGGGED